MEYLKVFCDFVEVLTMLGDAERGRLFTAMLVYAKSGEEPNLSGNERFVWPAAKQNIDRAAAVASKRSEYGSAGGKQRQANASKQQQTVANSSKPKQTVAIKEKEKDKDNIKDNKVGGYNAREESTAAGFGVTDEQIAQSISRDETIERTARDYGLDTNAGSMVVARRMASDYSLEWLLKAIERGGMNAKGGLSWRYVESILTEWKKHGGIDEPTVSQKKATGKVLNAQNYDQRTYTPEEIAAAQQRAYKDLWEDD